MKKRFMCLLMVFMLCLCTAFSASAESFADDKQPGNVVTMSVPGTVKPMYNSSPAGTGGYISGGYGELSCSLNKNVASGWVQATVSPSSASGMVSCSVKLPNGTYKYLGSVPASGGSTALVTMYTLKTGTYTFVFQATTTAELYCSGRIYE